MVTHEDIAERLEKGVEQFATIRASLASIDTTLKHHGEILQRCEKQIIALEADSNQRKGRDGVLAAIGRSPVLAWIVGIAAAAWAAFTHTTNN